MTPIQELDLKEMKMRYVCLELATRVLIFQTDSDNKKELNCEEILTLAGDMHNFVTDRQTA